MRKLAEVVLKEIESVLNGVREEQVEEAVTLISNAKRIFVFGEGRSGFMAKSFAMRLMHLGASAYVIGETTTPSIGEKDLVILVSGSGKTKSVVWTAEKAMEAGCTVLATTTDSSSPLAQNAFSLIEVPAATKYRKEGEKKSIQPLGSLFDQSVHLLFDILCIRYAEKKERTHEQTFQLHSNVE